MNNLTVETRDAFSSLHEKAANNDVEGFKRLVECDPSAIDEIGLWYGRMNGSKQMVYEHRTPLMVASMYGSIDVLRLIVSLSVVDVNRSCGMDKSTALHCAASGGSVEAVEAVKLLLKAGAEPNLIDANGCRPIDVIVVPPKFHHVRSALEELLAVNGPPFVEQQSLRVSTMASSSSNSSPRCCIGSLSSSASESPPSPLIEKKEYPVDPSLPDIKNSIYATDEFRMYSFKIRSCSRAYSHDWTECPFVHPGENARRRDPRKYHYSCVPCPDFRKGVCRRGDMCEYAHGVFESWLHPAQYRTRLCKDGMGCSRRVCFFAHNAEELRPLYLSSGSPSSPRSSMEIAAAMSCFLPSSPSAIMSPSSSGNGISHSSSLGWTSTTVHDVPPPTLRLPGSNLLQSSRLRSSLHARDINPPPLGDFDMLLQPDFDIQQQELLLSELLSYRFINSNSSSSNRCGRLKILNPANHLDDMFSSAEGSSPRYGGGDQGQLASAAAYSPTHRTAVLNQFQQQQQQGMLFPKTMDQAFLQASLSPRSMEPISPLSSQGSVSAHHPERQLHQFRSLSSRELGSNAAAIVVGSPVHSWSKWGSCNANPDWGVHPDELSLSKLRKSSSFELGNGGEEPDLSWVQSLVKESPTDLEEKLTVPILHIDEDDAVSDHHGRHDGWI
ncbi:hypothetical protein Dimus_001982 [Dionaea muscipula]